MKTYNLYIDPFIEGFICEVYDRNQNDNPDYSIEYSEQIEMTSSELADQIMTKNIETQDTIKIPIDKNTRHFLIKVYKHFQWTNGLFGSFEMTEEMEEFLYWLGEYLTKGDFSEPFSFCDCLD